MSIRKTTENLFPRSVSGKLRRVSSGGSIVQNSDIPKSDYSQSIESDDGGSKKDHINDRHNHDNENSNEKQLKNKKPKKLSKDEIRERIDKDSVMLEGLYNTYQLIIAQNNNLNKRMKTLEDHLNIQQNKDVSSVSGEDDTCSMSNFMGFFTG